MGGCCLVELAQEGQLPRGLPRIVLPVKGKVKKGQSTFGGYTFYPSPLEIKIKIYIKKRKLKAILHHTTNPILSQIV